MHSLRHILFALIISLFSPMIQAQNTPAEYVPNPAEVESVDAILHALYDVISGPAGPRNWDRMRYLCKPAVQFNAISPDGKGGEVYVAMTMDGYIERAGGHFLKTGFYESEIGRQYSGYRNVVQVLSTFSTRFEEHGEIVAQGTNSIQLVKDQGRWWIVNILWNNLPQGQEMPKSLLKMPKEMKWEE